MFALSTFSNASKIINCNISKQKTARSTIWVSNFYCFTNTVLTSTHHIIHSFCADSDYYVFKPKQKIVTVSAFISHNFRSKLLLLTSSRDCPISDQGTGHSRRPIFCILCDRNKHDNVDVVTNRHTQTLSNTPKHPSHTPFTHLTRLSDTLNLLTPLRSPHSHPATPKHISNYP